MSGSSRRVTPPRDLPGPSASRSARDGPLLTDLGEHGDDVSVGRSQVPLSINSDGEPRTAPKEESDDEDMAEEPVGTEQTTTKVDSTITFSGNPDELPGLWFHMDMKVLLDGTLSNDGRKCAYAASLFRGKALTWLAKRQSRQPATLSDYAAFKTTVNATWGLSEEAMRMRTERDLIRLSCSQGHVQEFNASFESLASEIGLSDMAKALLYSAKLPMDYQDRILVTGRRAQYSTVSAEALRIDLSLSAIKGKSESKKSSGSGRSRSKNKKKESKSPTEKGQGGGGSTKPAGQKQMTVKAEVNMISIRSGADTGRSPETSYVSMPVCGVNLKCFVDSGSAVNCLRTSFAIGYKVEPSNIILEGPTGAVIADHPGFVMCPVDGIPQRFYLVEGLREQAILGRPYLEKVRALDVFCVDTDGEWDSGGKLRPLSVPEQEAQDAYLKEALRENWIRPTASSVTANVLFVEKGNGKLRFCVDYRKVNAVTRRDQYPIPLLRDLLHLAMPYRYFTVKDGKAAFHRLSVRPGDEWKLAFKTNAGAYEYCVMPFGVTNGPSYQQRFMDNILLPHEAYCRCYLDDIIIFSNDVTSHQEQVRAVEATLDEHNVITNDEKAQAMKERVKFLGFWLSHGKLEADVDIQAIRDWPVPKDKTRLQSFLGLANWYRGNCPGLATAAAPLYSLSGKQGPLVWGTKAQASFEATKQIILANMAVHMFELKYDIEVYTDASQEGTGAIMVQNGNVIGIISKGLSDAEKNYTTTERELLAVVRAVKAWRHYLESTKQRIVVFTDHKSITQDLNASGTNRRLNRWLLLLGQYPIEYWYCPGKDNPADHPSRMGFTPPASDDDDFLDDSVDWEMSCGSGYWDNNGGSPQWVQE